MSTDEFVNELKTKSKNCEFREQRDYMIHDRLIFGIKDERLRERLLRDSENPDLERVIDLCRAVECSKNQMKEIKGDHQIEIVQKRMYNKNKHARQATANMNLQNKQQHPSQNYKIHTKQQPIETVTNVVDSIKKLSVQPMVRNA